LDLSLQQIILDIPTGYSEVRFQNKKYSLTRSDFNEGRSLKVFARELGGRDFISFNYYRTPKGESLKPCEMPEQKVVDFLLGMGEVSQPVEADKYGLTKIYKAHFDEEPDRYEFRQGFPDMPVCPWGGSFAGLGYDRKEERYVWLVKSVLRDKRLVTVSNPDLAVSRTIEELDNSV
jgi:hypothetical protein